MENKKGFSKIEKSWIQYDAANSAFTLLSTSIIPIYFASLAKNAGVDSMKSTEYWGYILAASTLLIAIIGPILGAAADYKGMKMRLFLIFMGMGVAGCGFLGLVNEWIAFIIIFFIAKIGYSGTNVFYDSMLTDVTEDDRMDNVSSFGYAIGYIASCVPFIISMVLILVSDKIGLDKGLATKFSFGITMIWWVVFSIPLIKNYKQRFFLENEGKLLSKSVGRIILTLKNMKQQKKIFLFMLAFFFYIDAVYTIIGMAASYGTAVGIDDQQMLLALLLTQIIAFPCAIIFGKLARRFNAKKLIEVCIVGYIFIALFAVQLDRAWEFWFLAVMVALFQGGIQALSRSYFGKIVPKDRSNEYFGLFDIFGKYADFFGPLIMSAIIGLTGIPQLGVAGIAILLVIGFVIMKRVPDDQKVEQRSGDYADRHIS